MKSIISFFSAFIMLFSACAPLAASQRAEIYVKTDAEPCTLHGVAYLEKTIRTTGLAPAGTQNDDSNGTAVFTIVITDASKSPAAASEFNNRYGIAIPEKAESFAIAKQGKTIYAAGSDAVGAMYAAYEIAEELQMHGKDKLLDSIQNKSYSPFMEIRAVNPFIHVDAVNDPGSWYFDDSYWETYLDELSLDRYNLLDIHAMYELLSTAFPNCYLYLFHSDRFPDVGVPQAAAAKNLEQFKKIVDMAKKRGIRTSLMSYHAGWSKADADKTPEPNDKDLSDYTAEMVDKTLKDIPDLWMTGFRIGESGRQEDFFKDSYLRGIENGGRDIFLFTRSWQAKAAMVRGIGDAYPGRFFVEIKYNGEQLGLPYQAITVNRSAPSYSWEDYTNWPRNYKIIWQVRANGTHRLFRWGDPDFARRVARSLEFGHAAGFSMEPMSSYYPPTDFFHKNHADFDYFKWDHQRNWYWYMLWGRMTYDPATPDDVWLARFGSKFGAKGAKDVFDTVKWMSRIVPLIYSYRCIGLDHREMAPEYEPAGSLSDFATNEPLDPYSMRPIDEYVRWRLFDGDLTDAKLGPFKAADLLETYASNAQAAAERAKAAVPAGNKEFADILAELECLSHLAKYHSNKLRAATYFDFFKQKNTLDDLALAKSYTAAAHSEWDLLSAAGAKYYGRILDTLRIKKQNNGKPDFTWSELRPQLDKDVNEIDGAEKAFAKDNSGTLWHRPPWRAPAGKDFTVTATLASAQPQTPLLNYAPADKDEWKSVPMKAGRSAGVFEAAIPGSAAHGDIRYYITAGEQRFPNGKKGSAKSKDFDILDYANDKAKRFSADMKRIEAKEKKEFLTLHFYTESEPPVIAVDNITVTGGGKKAVFRVKVTDGSGVKTVQMRYKKIPTINVWQELPMKPAGDGFFEAETPLDREGVLYNFSAADIHGNAAAYPDLLNATPYLWIDAWDPAKNPYKE